MDALSDSGALNQKGGAGHDSQSELSEGGVFGKGTPHSPMLGGCACAERWAGCAGGDAPSPARPALSGACAKAGPWGPEQRFGGIKTNPGEWSRGPPELSWQQGTTAVTPTNSSAARVCHPLKPPPPPQHTHTYIYSVYKYIKIQLCTM